MEPLDLKKFLWVSKETKNAHLILAITLYNGESVVIHRQATNTGEFYVQSVDKFCTEFDATYPFGN